MKKIENTIYIVGRRRAKGVFRKLNKRRQNVHYFKEEILCSNSLNCNTRIVIMEESHNSAILLDELKKHPKIHIIFLSNNTSFIHVIKTVRKGVTDYILKDAFLFYSILKSIKKSENINDFAKHSKRVYFDTCDFKNSSPVGFKIAKWFSLF